MEMFYPRNLARAKSLALNSERKTGGPKLFQSNANIKSSQVSSAPNHSNRFRGNDNFFKDNNSSFQRSRFKWIPNHNNSNGVPNHNNFGGIKKVNGDTTTKNDNSTNQGTARPIATI